MQDTIINFYSTSDDYGDFSNFAAWPIKVDGKTWPTSEHYFQAQKFLDEKYREEIRRVSSPMVAARMGRDRSKPLRKNWESVKEQVMRKALRAKFEQHAELRALLLATAPAKLVEHTDNDAYWETVVMVRARIDWATFNGVARTIGYREVTSRWLMGGKTDKFFPVFSNC